MKELRIDLKLTSKQMAKYLGVSVATYYKWESQQRGQSAAVLRLLDVLNIIRTFCPSVHDQLINEAKGLNK